MKKITILFAIFCLVMSPSFALASPGSLDQYGGHVCSNNCQSYGEEMGEYHFHEIPSAPSYLKVEAKPTNFATLFFMPKAKADQTVLSPASMAGNESNTLIQNIIYDEQLCVGAEISASGFYTGDPKVRISPVCAQRQIEVLGNTNLNPSVDYYRALSNDNLEISKVYHVVILKNGKNVFTDRPEISDLKGIIIQGVTDATLYYVNPNDENLSLRPITAEKAVQLKGVNYLAGVAYFDDSIIYSYPISRPLM
ncbi:MAG: hypothetical protein PHC97_00465 [Patescibacteria group bacterium]|nr:hypothetical protein [Patescibacteria group bacterium]